MSFFSRNSSRRWVRDGYFWVDFLAKRIEIDDAIPEGLLAQKPVPLFPLLDIVPLLVHKPMHLKGGLAHLLKLTQSSYAVPSDLLDLVL